jgi:hypothetical protein
LDALLALPSIDRNLTGSVYRTAAVLQESSAKRLTRCTECNRIREFSVTGSQARTDMTFTHRISKD